MDWFIEHGPIVVSVLSAAGALYAIWSKAKTDKSVATVQGAANAILGYKELCDDLQAERKEDRAERMALHDRLDANAKELAELRRQLTEVQAENVHLREKIKQLEEERASLKAQLEDLQRCRTV